jgi:1,4-alpha-glucan branching enzyme
MKTKTVVPKREFVLRAPEAKAVALVGDFTHWEERPIPMKKSRTGVWKAQVPLGPGTYHYRFLVDGQWSDDPLCPLRSPNPYGSQDDICIVT